MVTLEAVEQRAKRDANQHGIYLTSDKEQLKWLLEGLRENEEKYGYPSCPCRLASGNYELDRDIICPCDYRDLDVAEFGTCYCNLYVDEYVYQEERKAYSIPERRPPEKQMAGMSLEEEQGKDTEEKMSSNSTYISRLVYYCKQCGYMVFREEPPYVCPICQAKGEMFDLFKVILRTE